MKKWVFSLTVLILFASAHKVFGKSYEVNFYESGSNLVIALDQSPEGMFTEFYYIKLISPLNKSLFEDGKYKISVKKGVLVMKSKKRTLILTTDKSVIQTAFRQKGVYYILVNGISKGNAVEQVTAEDVIYSVNMSNPFEQETKEIDLGAFRLEIISRNKNYFENLELGYF
jgi:hypothetical protein